MEIRNLAVADGAVDSQSMGAGNATSDKTYGLAFSLVTSLFFIFGFITCLNDILVPHLKALFELDYTKASLVQFCFFGAFFLISLPAGRLLSRLGYQRTAAAGLVLTGIGCCLFYPAAASHSYALFLFGLFVLASGVTVIQVAVNPYIAILGPAKTSSVRLNLAQAFNSLGTTLAPLVGSLFILAIAVKKPEELALLSPEALSTYRADQAASVQGPYLVLALVLFVLAAVFGLVRLPKMKVAGDNPALNSIKNVLKSRRLVLGAVGIFCYVGAEVAIGSYLINFLGLPNIWGLGEAAASSYVAIYWGGAMVGRFVGSAILNKISPAKVLMFSTAAAAALVLLAVATTGGIAAWAIIAVGLFNSIMFPTIFTLAIEGLEENTPQGSAVLCMAIVGGAIIPVIQGVFADRAGLQLSLIIPVVCYAFIYFYGQFVSRQTLVTAKV